MSSGNLVVGVGAGGGGIAAYGNIGTTTGYIVAPRGIITNGTIPGQTAAGSFVSYITAGPPVWGLNIQARPSLASGQIAACALFGNGNCTGQYSSVGLQWQSTSMNGSFSASMYSLTAYGPIGSWSGAFQWDQMSFSCAQSAIGLSGSGNDPANGNLALSQLSGSTCLFWSPVPSLATSVSIGFACTNSGTPGSGTLQLGLMTYDVSGYTLAGSNATSVKLAVNNGSVTAGSVSKIQLVSAAGTHTISQSGNDFVVTPNSTGDTTFVNDISPSTAGSIGNCGTVGKPWANLYTAAGTITAVSTSVSQLQLTSTAGTHTISQSGNDLVVTPIVTSMPTTTGKTAFVGAIAPNGINGNAGSCGTMSFPWSVVYTSTGLIQPSDENSKTNMRATTLGTDFIMAIKPVQYRRKVGTRTHHGFGARQINSVLVSLGMSGEDFAGFIDPTINEPGSEAYCGLRYEEFISPMVAMLQEQQRAIVELRAALKALGA